MGSLALSFPSFTPGDAASFEAATAAMFAAFDDRCRDPSNGDAVWESRHGDVNATGYTLGGVSTSWDRVKAPAKGVVERRS